MPVSAADSPPAAANASLSEHDAGLEQCDTTRLYTKCNKFGITALPLFIGCLANICIFFNVVSKFHFERRGNELDMGSYFRQQTVQPLNPERQQEETLSSDFECYVLGQQTE